MLANAIESLRKYNFVCLGIFSEQEYHIRLRFSYISSRVVAIYGDQILLIKSQNSILDNLLSRTKTQ